LCGFTNLRDFQRAHRQWVEQTLESGRTVRDDRWSEAIAVGSLVFVESVKSELGRRAMDRGVEQKEGAYALRERNEAYSGNFSGESESLRLETRSFGTKTLQLRRHSTVRPRWLAAGGSSLFHWTIPLGVNYYGGGDEF
jgi:hypothetical protein